MLRQRPGKMMLRRLLHQKSLTRMSQRRKPLMRVVMRRVIRVVRRKVGVRIRTAAQS